MTGDEYLLIQRGHIEEMAEAILHARTSSGWRLLGPVQICEVYRGAALVYLATLVRTEKETT